MGRAKKLYTSCEQLLNPMVQNLSTPLHIPVLLHETITLLNPQPGSIFIDCTLGAGGHTEALLNELKGTGAVYGIDADERNLTLAKERLSSYKNAFFIHNNFGNLADCATRIRDGAVSGKKVKSIDGVLFDLGLSSLHVDEAERGFSFRNDGPLDMRFDTRSGDTAADIVNTWSLNDLSELFRTLGQDKFGHRIAMAIVEARRQEKFTTTKQLAELIVHTVPGKFRFGPIHPATRIFQALRIATNREIEVLVEGLNAALEAIAPGGRVVVIAYHSIEDRIVKNLFRDLGKEGNYKVLTKKPIVPTPEEVATNKRSRSAKLRAIEKLL